MTLEEILGSSLFDSVSKIIEQFHMSPEQKAQVQAELAAQKAAIDQAQNDYNVKLNDIAGQNIRAEEQNGDKFTERARPAVIWAGLAMAFWNYCLVPTIGLHWHIPQLPIPDMFLEIWGVVTTGYVFNRTVDKALALPGQSSIKLPFGIQYTNNSTGQ